MVRLNDNQQALTDDPDFTENIGNNRTGPKWLSSPVRNYKGTIADIRRNIPFFERRDFALKHDENEKFRENTRQDVIIRKPFGEDTNYVPLSVVSKGYKLIPHSDVVDAAERAVESLNISLSETKAELEITEFGERMRFSLCLPDKYSFDPGDGHPMALRLECLNSVDGSARLRAMLGWYRFVCSNGMIIGVTRVNLASRHVGSLSAGNIQYVLKKGMAVMEEEKQNLGYWRSMRISQSRIDSWADRHLNSELGFKAAARVCHIAKSGYDGEIDSLAEDEAPSKVPMRKTEPVPGAPELSDNLFDISQILAWLARDRRDLQEQMKWREQIPELMSPPY